MKELRVLDLFAGIGGFSYGLEQANSVELTTQFRTKAFCEIDKHAQKVLSKHWPDVPVFEDVSKLNGNMLRGKIDIICGGFPCQDISVAGKKKGLIDEEGKATRSGLWFQYKRLIEEIRPRWVLIENVANLRSKGLATVLKDLSEIGYDAEWDVISARDVGACHLRERIWIVAYRAAELTNTRENQQTATADADDFRFWPTFTTEEEKSQWWSSTTAQFSSWWKTESRICRVDDGLSKELDKGRSQRIKQLGNSIVPVIVTLIGKQILEYEN